MSESMLCYFSTHLACKKLSSQTIKAYLSAIRHMQITLGLPEPREFSTPSAGSIWNSADMCKPTDSYQSSIASYPNNSVEVERTLDPPQIRHRYSYVVGGSFTLLFWIL